MVGKRVSAFRRFLFLLALTSSVACGAEDDSTQVRRQAVKPEPLCAKGERVCDFDGNVRQCAGQSGLHRKNPTNSVGPIHSCSDGKTCYFGACSNGPDVKLPPQGTGPSLVETAVDVVSAPVPALVIPYEAFSAALAGRAFEKPSDTTIKQARILAGAVNDPTVSGLTATFEETDFFEGELFIVTFDAERYEQGSPSSGTLQITTSSATTGETVESVDFLIAAVRLSGKTSWVGRDPSHTQYTVSNTGTSGALPSWRCCEGGQPNDSCAEAPDDTGPFPCTDPIDCGTYDPRILLETDVTKQPFRAGNGGVVRESEPVLRSDGQEAKFMYVLDDRSAYLGTFDQETSEAWADALTDGSSEVQGHQVGPDEPGVNPIKPPGLYCDWCTSVALCRGPNDPDYRSGQVGGAIPNECGNVPFDAPKSVSG